MKSRIAWLMGGTAVMLGLSAAAPPPDWRTLLRQGDAAYGRGDYAAAAALYEQAQDRATDPGLVAMDLAAATIRWAEASEADRARLAREAEQAYRCCTGPGDPRRPRALYGLGDALMLKSAGRDADALKAAVAAYNQCLAEPNLDAALADDAHQNLERARLLLLQITPAVAPSKDEPSSGDGSPRPKPPPDKGHGPQPDPSHDSSAMKVKPDPNGGPAKSDDAKKPMETDAPPPPGEGDLPPVPDSADLPPLSAEDAARGLDQAAQHILQDLKAHRRAKATVPPPNVPDW